MLDILLNIALFILIFFLGAAIGSFSLVILRRSHDPDAGSWTTGRSYCESCRHELRWYELVPFFSFLFLRGRCLKCKAKIPIDHFLCETGLGIIFASIWHLYQIGFLGEQDVTLMTRMASANELIPDGFIALGTMVLWMFAASILWILSFSDFLYREIDPLPTYILAGVALLWNMLLDWHKWPYIIVCVVMFVLLETLGSKDDSPLMGMGDIYAVIAIIALLCSIMPMVDIIGYAALIGILLYILIFMRREESIPFVPCLFFALILISLNLGWTQFVVALLNKLFKL